MNIKPMLASPQKRGNITNWSEWAIEEKFDGHRLLIEVTDTRVAAFARPRKDDRMIQRELPDHLNVELAKLAPGLYDGELLGGDTGTDVTRKDLAKERRIVLFDMPELTDPHTGKGATYTARHATLAIRWELANANPRVLMVSPSLKVTSEKDVAKFVKRVWAAGGEGAILKQLDSRYEHKRSKNWIKIKRVSHAILTVIGFEQTRGKVLGRGAFAVVVLRDDDGNETTVKTKNDDELAEFNEQWLTVLTPKQRLDPFAVAASTVWGPGKHPAIGKRLLIEFPKRTRTDGYQGPVLWDRWAEKGETL